MSARSSALASISIHYDSKFSLHHVTSVLAPLFENYYGIDRLRSIILNAHHVWCAYDENLHRFVACALLENRDDDNTLYMNLFGVEMPSQGRGIGKCLLKAIKKWARKQHYSAIVLHTQIDNNRALALYEKLGFQKQHYLKEFFSTSHLDPLVQPFQPDAYQLILHL